MGDSTCYTVELVYFSFPAELDKDKSNFRLQVALRYRTADGEYEVKTVIMPGLDIYWECSEDRNKKKDIVAEGPGALVRASALDDEFENRIDTDKAGVWGRRFRVCASELYELRVTVFDVDRKDWLEKVAGAIKSVITAVASLAGSIAGGALKAVGEEAAAGLGRRMASGDDRLLICHSAEYSRTQSNWVVERGGYRLEFRADGGPPSTPSTGGVS